MASPSDKDKENMIIGAVLGGAVFVLFLIGLITLVAGG